MPATSSNGSPPTPSTVLSHCSAGVAEPRRPAVQRRTYGAAASMARATWNITGSPNAGASTWTPIGNAPSAPNGTEIAHCPDRFTGTVHTSQRYIAHGSAVFAPISNATVGDVGESNTSKSSY